jgi:hypothetical protein
MVTAIAKSIVAGSRADQLVPNALNSHPAGTPRTSIPRNIARTISA